MSIVQELKRRNVFRVAVAYLSAAWLLIEVAETLFPIYGFSDASLRLVVALLAIGFPLSLVVSWVYEVSPDGVRLEKDIDPSAPRPASAGKRLDRLIIVLLASALGYFCFDKFVLEPRRVEEIAATAARTGAAQALDAQEAAVAQDKSVAVLPFANLSPNPGDDYFSDGLTEELIGTLARVDGLHVSARTSVFAFKGKHEDIRDIGHRLNVNAVLEGSVRREQNRVRITAQLINVGDGFELWSESYDYELESVLALQELISRAIVSALEVELSPRSGVPPDAQPAVDPEAYDLYLKGRYFWARLNSGGFQKSIEYFQKAIAIDPGYAPPHAGLANAYSFAGYFGVMPPSEAFPLSVREAEAALALDPDSVEAMVAHGMAALIHEWDWERARDRLGRALELGPNDVLANWAYTEYLLVADPAAALDSALHTLSLDPLSLPVMNLVAYTYMIHGMFAEAIRIDEEMIRMDPRFEAAHWNLGVVHMLGGRLESAIESLQRAAEYSGGMPPTLAVLSHAHALSGDEANALAVLAELERHREAPGRGYVSPVLIAYAHEGLGRTERSLEWLDKGFEERDGWLVFLNAFPRFESLRGEPRFQDLLQRLDLPER